MCFISVLTLSSCPVLSTALQFSFLHQTHSLNFYDRNLNACKFLIPDLDTDLWHCRSISCLCMLFKIYHNPAHSLHSELPSLFQPMRETRYAVNPHCHSFSAVRCSTTQYWRWFIPAFIKCWSNLPSRVMECSELQKFKAGGNKDLLDIHI